MDLYFSIYSPLRVVFVGYVKCDSFIQLYVSLRSRWHTYTVNYFYDRWLILHFYPGSAASIAWNVSRQQAT